MCCVGDYHVSLGSEITQPLKSSQVYSGLAGALFSIMDW